MTSTTSTTPAPAYDDLGSGEPALLLVPGWCGDRDVFDRVAGPLATRRRVLVSDVRGHGGLAGETADFDSAQVVDDLVALLDERGIDRVVPVTLSHAGFFALELRRRLGAERVPGVVLLDWMVLGPPPGFTDALAGLQSPEAWHDVRGALFGMWTAGVDHPGVHAYVASMGRYGAEHWGRAGREISAAFAAVGTPLAALRDLQPCPTLHVYAQPTDDGYLAAQQQAAAEHPWFHVVRLDAASHFPMFEVPDAMATAVEDFVGSLG